MKRTRSGQYEIRLSPEERALLQGLRPRMREVLTDEDDSVRQRLFPVAYPDDDDRQTEYRLLAHGELLDSHLAALAVLEETVGAERLDEEALSSWMRALNEVRLVLGTRLEISEDGDERPLHGDDPEAQAFAIYDYLTWLQGEIIEALSG
ncbi:MAG: DUF2017 domain-containing protein [Actinomycetota bacterium]|nr:DUF2017 domain-containing protein [Actinomycetota bacterium]